MDIAGIMVYFTANWEAFVKIILQVIGLASIVVKLTPTLKDDDVLKNVVRFLGKYIALNRSSSDSTTTANP